ncbi:FkbM family methyltransferase [Azospirillum agricola]|uniref:FkbM family methyltransferase n=1 Tax=Azospirillum agricola TaxID=1720247 RepID=UPI000A0F0F9E|nr:FkbM family methyltransferase [Azospirillum agricola]SMH41396.1 methyltransferase, FkbM family [Azospirillum lipoferum]
MDIFEEYYKSLNGVGILNYRNMQESGEEHFIRANMTKLQSPVIFDVGANSGIYSKTLLEFCPSASIFAFEPHPINFKNLTDNGDPRIRAFNIGAGAVDEVAEFYDYQNEDGSEHASLYKGVIEDIHQRPSVCHRVPIRRLDGVAAELGVSRIHFLKIDTEGHELEVLRGAEGLIRSNAVDIIQFEFNETNVVSRVFFKDFWDFLPNYKFHRLLPKGALHISQYSATFCEVFAYQNYVCVRKDSSIFG